jgi:hypothetical protein
LFGVFSFVDPNPYDRNAGSPNIIGLIIGIGLLVVGIIAMSAARDSYTVKISTASGEIKAFTSEDAAFTQQIVEALNTAIVQKG